jgi:hypothetical protein
VGEPVRPDHDSSPFEIAVVHVEQRDGGDVLDTEEIQPIAIMPVDAQPSRSQCRDEVPFVGSGVHSYTRLVERPDEKRHARVDCTRIVQRKYPRRATHARRAQGRLVGRFRPRRALHPG